MAEPLPGLERELGELLAHKAGVRAELRGDAIVLWSQSRSGLALANLIEEAIIRARRVPHGL